MRTSGCRLSTLMRRERLQTYFQMFSRTSYAVMSSIFRRFTELHTVQKLKGRGRKDKVTPVLARVVERDQTKVEMFGHLRKKRKHSTPTTPLTQSSLRWEHKASGSGSPVRVNEKDEKNGSSKQGNFQKHPKHRHGWQKTISAF